MPGRAIRRGSVGKKNRRPRKHATRPDKKGAKKRAGSMKISSRYNFTKKKKKIKFNGKAKGAPTPLSASGRETRRAAVLRPGKYMEKEGLSKENREYEGANSKGAPSLAVSNGEIEGTGVIALNERKTWETSVGNPAKGVRNKNCGSGLHPQSCSWGVGGFGGGGGVGAGCVVVGFCVWCHLWGWMPGFVVWLMFGGGKVCCWVWGVCWWVWGFCIVGWGMCFWMFVFCSKAKGIVLVGGVFNFLLG